MPTDEELRSVIGQATQLSSPTSHEDEGNGGDEGGGDAAVIEAAAGAAAAGAASVVSRLEMLFGRWSLEKLQEHRAQHSSGVRRR